MAVNVAPVDHVIVKVVYPGVNLLSVMAGLLNNSANVSGFIIIETEIISHIVAVNIFADVVKSIVHPGESSYGLLVIHVLTGIIKSSKNGVKLMGLLINVIEEVRW